MKNKWIIIPAFALGCSLCFWGHQWLSLSVVVSSCIVGFLGSFITSSKYTMLNACPAAIYSGSFAGMCSSEIIKSNFELFSVSIVGGIVYLSIDRYFTGIGGKLGTVAFCSVAIVYLLKQGVL